MGLHILEFKFMLKGQKHKKETKQKMKEAKLKNPTKYWLGRHITKEHNDKLQKGRLKLRKEKHWNWQGGINPINDTIRKSIEFKIWREAIFKRDNFACQKCKKIGEKIHAHHIKPFAYYPELRFAIDNGITFCKECHKEFHKKYGIKNNNTEQIIIYIEL